MKCDSAIAIFITILLSGCASYQAKPAAMPVPSMMPYSHSDSFLEVYAEPCVQVDRQMELFDADLAKVGVIPIQVFIRNKTDRSLVLSYEDTWLELPGGARVLRTYLSEFFKQREEPKEEPIEQPEPKELPQPKESPEKEPSFASDLAGAALGGAIAGAIEGALPLIVTAAIFTAPIWGPAVYMHYRSEQAWTQRLEDYDSKEQPLLLDKEKSSHGFLFFVPPRGTPAFDEATLNVSIRDMEKTLSSVIRVQVKGLEFKETPAE